MELERESLRKKRSARLAAIQGIYNYTITGSKMRAEILYKNLISQWTQSASEHLAQVLRVQRYYETTAEQAHLAAQLQSPGAGEAAAAPQHALFVQRSDALLALCDPLPGPPDPVAVEAAEISMEAAYDPLKVALLAAGASGALRLVAMEEALRRYSALRRAAQQAAKAVHRNPVPPAVAPAP